MIELNLLEKKQPFVLPSILGMDLNVLNFKMLAVALVIYYSPGFIVGQIFDEKIEQTQASLTKLTADNEKLKNDVNKEGNIKSQYQAYKEQVTKLQNRSNQVDEILKNRTNPKKILEKIARSIPEDVWFNELTININNEIYISGGAYTPRAVGEFITTINDSPYFGGSITPSKQENKKDNLDGTMTSFELFELRGKIINYDMRSK
jgi:Tfp pilus assembly protein PilN